MTEQNQTTALAKMVTYLDRDEIKKRFTDMLGKKANSFMNSYLNLVRSDSKLAECEPESVKNALMIPATLNLSVEKSLGECYIIPYKGKAQVQIGYKGLVQLCIRSGQYKHIHCSEVYSDEFKLHNPITGVVEFNDPKEYKLRKLHNPKDVVGHYAYFMLLSGFEKGDYMTTGEAMAHAKQFSQAYQYDLRVKKSLCPWSNFPIQMGNKTVLKRLLLAFGIKSVEIQNAAKAADDGYELEEEAARKRVESQQGQTEVEAEFEPKEEQELTPQQKAARTRAANKAKQAAAEKAKLEAEQNQPEAEPEQSPPANGNASPLWYCKCEKGKEGFSEPKMAGATDKQFPVCPHCFTGDHLVAPGEV